MPNLPSGVALFFTLALVGSLRAAESGPRDPALLSTEFCVGCHGVNLVGGIAPNLLDTIWKSGGDDASILRSIRAGAPEAGMPAFGAALTEAELQGLLGHIHRGSRMFALGAIPSNGPAPTSVAVKSEKAAFRLETFAGPLDTPWGIVFLPGNRMLVSDRIGELRMIEKGVLVPAPIRDTPKPFVRQDGGYLDLIAHPDYAKNGWLYLAYTELGANRSSSMTRVVRGKIREGAWVEQQDIFKADQKYYYNDTSHYGCRFLFDRAGHLFFTLGERGNAADAQNITSPLGKIHRVFDDGRIPPDNPFVGRAGACESIWTYGNRHVQGLQFHPVTGKLWATEHGPRGGDELNRIEPGRNYGWPVASNGLAQRDEKIEGPAHEGMESPVAWWSPSVASAAIEFYTGDRFPPWKNNLFIACLVGRQLKRLETDGDKVVHQEILFAEMGRVRDVVTGPDGLIYLAMNNPGRIARLVPDAPRPADIPALPPEPIAPPMPPVPAALQAKP
ncbi:MAG: glucose sorbosone dehydrogenase [Opitutus sp.]|nr:glucose sorbosone dehydrogenase [Opitutus sp.]